MTPPPGHRPHTGGGGVRSIAPAGSANAAAALFDPAKPDVDLFDSLAEQQADRLGAEVSSSQLRRFYGEIKDLARRLDELSRAGEPAAEVYAKRIEPRFKMIRSKVAYACPRNARSDRQQKIPVAFADMLDAGIAKVGNVDDFRRFVTHLEAVVGFMYGKGMVKP